MLLDRAEEGWGSVEDGIEESSLVWSQDAPAGACEELSKNLVAWHRTNGDDKQAQELLARYVALNPESNGGIENAMGVGHIQARSWHKNARKFAAPVVSQGFKSAVIAQTARKLKLPVVDVPVADVEPKDMKGLPRIVRKPKEMDF